MRDCVSAFNIDGVTISNSAQVTLLRDTLYGNTASQVAQWSEMLNRGGNFDIDMTMRGP